MRRIGWVLLVAGVLWAPTHAHAQIAWETPFLVPPAAPDGFGLFIMDAAGGGIGVLGTYRSPGWNYGLRGGIAEADDDDIGIFAGLDYAGTLTRATDQFPLDVDWVFGAGLGVSDGALVTVPLGLSAGHTFRAEGATFTPFLTPRVLLDGFFGRDRRGDSVELGLAMDLGLDLRFARTAGGPFAGMIVRFAASVGDHEGLAIGVVF